MPQKASLFHKILVLLAQIFVYGVLVVGIAILLPALLGPLLSSFLAESREYDWMVMSAIPGVLAGLIANFACFRLFEHRPLRDAGLNLQPASTWNLSWGLLVGFVAAAAITLVPLAVGGAGIHMLNTPHINVAHFVYVGLMLALASASEEVIMRGYLLQTLMRRIGVWPSLLLTGALFGSMHIGNPNASFASVLNTVLAGVALGYAFWRSGDLWFPIGMHIAWNLTFLFLGINLSGLTVRLTHLEFVWKMPDLWTGGAYGPEAGLLGTAALGAWMLIAAYAPVKRQPIALLETPPIEVEEPPIALGLNDESA